MKYEIRYFKVRDGNFRDMCILFLFYIYFYGFLNIWFFVCVKINFGKDNGFEFFFILSKLIKVNFLLFFD